MNDKPIITPENQPTWIGAGFIIALLALGLSVTNIYRTNMYGAMTQMQLLALNKKVDNNAAKQEAPAVAGNTQAAAASPTTAK